MYVHCSKKLPQVISIYHQNNPIKWVTIIIPTGEAKVEGLNNLPKVTQLVSGRAG